MPKIEIPFSQQEGKSESLQNSREQLTNMFVEIETSGRRRVIRRQRAGLEQIIPDTGIKRCIEKFGDLHYVIIDMTLYQFDGETVTNVGTIPSGSTSSRCTMIMDDNGNILISNGTERFYWTGSIGAGSTTPAAAGTLAYLNGYGIFNVPDEHQFFVTNLNDFSTVDALDFASAESSSDDLVRVFTDHNELWLFGKETTEIWQASGGADFPFTPFVNAHMQRGCAAAFSVAADDNTVFWLGDDRVVYRADGYRPVRVSTHPIERAIEAIPEAIRAQADAFIYTHGGHKFYTIRFPNYLTLQYNIATGLWNRAQKYGFDDWPVMGSAGRRSDYVLTDEGIAQVVDGSASLDFGGSPNMDESIRMRRSAVSAPIYANGNRVSCRSFRLDVEVGRVAQTGTIDIDPDPEIMLRYAPDGETFGNERWRSLGTTGNYKRRVVWRNLGIGERGTIEIAFTDDCELKIVGADADLVVANS
jgi:hypothetical protein